MVPFQGRYEVAVGRSCGGPRGQVCGQGRVLGSPAGLDLSTPKFFIKCINKLSANCNWSLRQVPFPLRMKVALTCSATAAVVCGESSASSAFITAVAPHALCPI